MNVDLEKLKQLIFSYPGLSESDQSEMEKLVKNLDREITVLEFKLDRTEKVKRTTSVLLEETIEELEKKRKDVEEANIALKESIKNLKAAQAQLIQSEKMASLGELTAGIAHEIQNPLNFVNNFSEVSVELIDEAKEEMADGEVDEVQEILDDLKKNLLKITHHGQRASGIVRSMLDHSRTSSGEKVETDINALCDEYLRLAYHGMRAKDRSFNAKIETSFDESIPQMRLIPQDIGRVLLNLINNGFQALSNQSSTKDIEDPMLTLITAKENNSVFITVRDNGPGIPGEIKDKIFQPFFTTKPTGQGTGLGLSLSYDIVKAHGGEISFESEHGKGTSFLIKLNIAGDENG